jgi:hypothetical protein
LYDGQSRLSLYAILRHVYLYVIKAVNRGDVKIKIIEDTGLAFCYAPEIYISRLVDMVQAIGGDHGVNSVERKTAFLLDYDQNEVQIHVLCQARYPIL